MPRSNRPKGRPASKDDDEVDLSRALLGRLSAESKRDGVWNVQPLAAASATKFYLAHTVTWRADGIMGEADDLASRRHWHLHCWKIKP
jgi:hypothetical protein